MNSNTGEIYRGDDVLKAMIAGEPVVPISDAAASRIEKGYKAVEQKKNRAQRRREERADRKRGRGYTR